jgi:phenylalanyl-tRNA synthetase beta chain
MKFSEKWLREWVNFPISTQELNNQLAMAGFEVDSHEPLSAGFDNVVVAEVLSAEPHPNADRLRLCQVSTGKETLNIVCGASNVRAGLKVALAMIGANLPNNVKIKHSKIRGVESEGMLCATRELGLNESGEGILELPETAPLGQSIQEYLQLDDTIIEVDIQPNRGDSLSIMGLAREIAALNDCHYKMVSITELPVVISDELPIHISASSACPRYLGRVIRNINQKVVTPTWLQQRLLRSGLRSINPVVDITNYVMLELGQPLHAFDLSKVVDHIHVRMANNGEKINLLNGQEVTLVDNTLIIADSEKALAIAGIMGGETSSVTAESQDIFLESAFFTPKEIIGRARQYGLHTDSSFRFERGVDFELQQLAIERATELLVQIVGGQTGPIVEVKTEQFLPVKEPILLNKALITRYLGMDISDETAIALLERLHIKVNAKQIPWQVTVPSYRFDITRDVDLIEEIARLHGYQHIPSHYPDMAFSPSQFSESDITHKDLRASMVGQGYQEVITYSFVEPKLQQLLDPEQVPLKLINPISAELAVMRTSLWPGLINSVIYNQRRQQERVRLFEIGQRFRTCADVLQQEYAIAAVAYGSPFPEQWGIKQQILDFFDVKADASALLNLTRRSKEFMFVPTVHPALLPGQSSAININGETVGYIGAIHPKLLQILDCIGPIFLFELTLDKLSQANLPTFKAFSKYPFIRRDIAIMVDQAVSSQNVLETIAEVGGKLLIDTMIFDVYEGNNIATGKKSLALGMLLQHPTRTLVDDEVNQVIANVVAALSKNCGAILRE